MHFQKIWWLFFSFACYLLNDMKCLNEINAWLKSNPSWNHEQHVLTVSNLWILLPLSYCVGRKCFYFKMMVVGRRKFMIRTCCKSFVLICFVSILLKLMEIICHLTCPSWFGEPPYHLSDLEQVCLCLQSQRYI